NMKSSTPPSTAFGISAMIAPTFGTSAITIRNAPPNATTKRLPTPVSEITPMFCEYDVSAMPPNIAESAEPKPSFDTAPRMRQPSAGTPQMRDTARVWPVVSTAVAKKQITTVITAINPGHCSPPYGNGVGTVTQSARPTEPRSIRPKAADTRKSMIMVLQCDSDRKQ